MQNHLGGQSMVSPSDGIVCLGFRFSPGTSSHTTQKKQCSVVPTLSLLLPPRMWALARDLRASETRITAGIPWLTAWAHLRLLSIGMEQDPKPSYVSVCLQGFSCTFLFRLVSLPLFLLSLPILSHLSTALYLQDLLFSPKGPFPILLSCYF